jgi:hypothetical protein
MLQRNQANVKLMLLKLPVVKMLGLPAVLLVVACWGSCMLPASEAAWRQLVLTSAKGSKACDGGRQPPLQHWQQQMV